MELKELLKLLKNKDKNAKCFCFDPNSNISFEIEQVQEISDEDGNIELVISCFENTKNQ